MNPERRTLHQVNFNDRSPFLSHLDETTVQPSIQTVRPSQKRTKFTLKSRPDLQSSTISTNQATPRLLHDRILIAWAAKQKPESLAFPTPVRGSCEVSLHAFSSFGVGLARSCRTTWEANRDIYKKQGLVRYGEMKNLRYQDNKYITLYLDYLFYPFSIHIVDACRSTMSVFTIVHRALPPLSLPWKRQTSLKGKAPELGTHLNGNESILSDSNSNPHAQNNESISMPRDVHGHVQVAVKTNAHHIAPTLQSTSSTLEHIAGAASDSSPECRAHYSNQARPTRAQLARAVSWASIIRSRDRWTVEQERELVHAQRQLERCQKAWSSEQEVWLSYVCGKCFSYFSCCVLFYSLVDSRTSELGK